MTQATNPFANFDMTKMMADFDPAKLTEQFTKAAADFKMPTVDVESFVAAQQKNIEALTVANKAAAEGAKVVATRQAELFQKTFDEAGKTIKTLTEAKNPQDAASLLQASFETALVNMREIADLVSKSNTEATDAINKRVVEGIEEAKTLAGTFQK